jgi:multiple sugar transport system substrate-binding protein
MSAAQYRQNRRRFLKSAGALGTGVVAAQQLGGHGALGASVTRRNLAARRQEGGTVNFLARGDEAIFSVFRELQEAFSEQEPDITVNIEEVPADFYQRFQLSLASGNPPDCLFESAGTIATSIRNGALHPLDDLIAGDDRFNLDDYFEISFHASTYDGATYGLPYDGGSLALYYNQDLFEQAGIPFPDPETPITWDQLLEYGSQLTTDRNGNHPGDDGFDPRGITQYAIAPPFNAFEVGVWIWGNGGEMITENGEVPIDEPAAAEGLQFLADMVTEHYIAPEPGIDVEQATFLAGQVAMEYSGVWNMVRYRDADFSWDIAPFPLGEQRVSTGFYSPLAITAASENKEAAWRWISFCCSEEGQRIVAGLGQAVPPVRSLAESEAFLDPDSPPEHKEVFLQEMDPEILRTPGDTMGRWFAGYGQEFAQIFGPAFDPVWRGEQTAAEAAADVRPRLEHLIETGEVT